MSRQIILDTETTGLEVDLGHRIIEIGCIELRNRRPTQNNFHRYINPEREIDAGAVNVHGITNERVAAEPNFTALAQQIWEYLERSEEHKSELQSLMRISYAVFCLKKKKT